MPKNEYDTIPVEYCAACTSLNLIEVPQGVMCNSCGTLNYTKEANIDTYLNEKSDGISPSV